MRILFWLISFSGCSNLSTHDQFRFFQKDPTDCKFLGIVEGEGEGLFSELTAGRKAMMRIEEKSIEMGGNGVYVIDQEKIDASKNSLSWKPKLSFTGRVYRCQ